MLTRLPRALRADAGAMSLVAVILGGVMLAFVGLVWDGGRGIASTQVADDLAAEAGRTAAQCVDVKHYLLTGTATVTSSDQAVGCATPYVKLVNAAGNGYTMEITDISFGGDAKDTLIVTVAVHQPVSFLANLGFSGTYIGHATVKLSLGVTDAGG